jgi:glutathione S-transferase
MLLIVFILSRSGVTDEQRIEKYNIFYTTVLPALLAKLAAVLGDQDYFVQGDKVTLADIAIFNMCMYLTFPACKVRHVNKCLFYSTVHF